jgi:hypothetical protein
VLYGFLWLLPAHLQLLTQMFEAKLERGYGKPAMQVAAQSENDGSEQKEFRTVEECRLFLLERGIDVARLPSPFAVIEGKTC